MKITSKSIEVAGRTLSLETGRFAAQAVSSVLAKYGETSVLAVVTTGTENHGKDYFPLSVDYQERLYAGGRIKGSRWVKREGRPTDAETLSGRLIDRTIRPLFPKGYKREVQVVVMVLSVDMDNDPDILGSIATSAALTISPIPWEGPVSTVRVGKKGTELIVNPQNTDQVDADLDLVVSSSADLITMIETGAKQVSEDTILNGFKLGLEENKKVINLINELVKAVGQPKEKVQIITSPPDLVKDIKKKGQETLNRYIAHAAQNEGIDMTDILSSLAEGIDEKNQMFIPQIVEEIMRDNIRTNILQKAHRPDGRKLDEIRPLNIEVNVLPRVHGSAIFQRGQTQALVVTTLGAPSSPNH